MATRSRLCGAICGYVGVSMLSMVVLTGCYHYTPSTFDAVSTESYVRAGLTGEKAVDLEQELGGLSLWVEGEVLERDLERNAILLAVPRRASTQASSSTRLRQRIWIGEQEVSRIEIRRIDRRRTVLLAAGVGTAVAVLLARALGIGSVDSTDGPPGGSEP